MSDDDTPRPRSRAEWNFQTLVWVFLQKALPFGAFAISIDEAAKRSKQANMARKARGCDGGVGDLFIYHGRIVLFLECKTHSGDQRAKQKAFQDGILRNGGHYSIVKTLDDVELACVNAGIPLRATLGDVRARIAEQNARLPAKHKRAARRPGQPLNQMTMAQYRKANAKQQA